MRSAILDDLKTTRTQRLINNFIVVYLCRLGNSEISVFATTTGTVDHMEPDHYKPGFVIFDDQHALSSSNGTITETIAGNSTESGYKEGIGSAARFRTINGLTQISSTQIIVSDRVNHRLRQVDRVTSLTSVLCLQISFPGTVMVDKKDATQLIVLEPYNKALRTVNLVSKIVGTLVTSSNFDSIADMVQDNSTGDIYITSGSNLYQISYITKSVVNTYPRWMDGQDRHLMGLYMLEAGNLLIADKGNNNLLHYRTDVNVTSKLKVCENLKAYIQSGSECVIYSPSSILIVKNQLLVGTENRILSCKHGTS